MNYKEVMDILKEASRNLGEELEKHFPGLLSLKYSEDSLASSAGADFVNRMVFGIYLELVRADLLNNIEPMPHE